MARGFAFPKLTSVFVVLGLVVSACGDTGGATKERVGSIVRGDSKVEKELRSAARAMQKTILEGTAAGAGGGAALDLVFGEDEDVGAGVSVGATAGAGAGTYVALIQRKYNRKARRLRAIKKDLDRNAEEMEATIAIMNSALKAQKAELAALRARAEADNATPRQVAREVAEAQDNLKQMNLAIQGASARQEEFNAARKLTKRRRQEDSPIDPDLAQLAGRIAEMKAIANDLATSL